MILQCKQTTRLPNRELSFFSSDNKEIGKGNIPKIFIGELAIYNEKITLEMSDGMVTNILCGESVIGFIKEDVVVTKKVLFLKTGYSFYRMKYKEKIYSVYESGLGPNKHFFSLYDEDTLTAVIHKEDLVINYCDSYNLYSENREAMIAACAFTTFLESTAYVDTTAGIGNMVTAEPFYTSQQELKDKYDPEFIPRILKIEEDLLENEVK